MTAEYVPLSVSDETPLAFSAELDERLYRQIQHYNWDATKQVPSVNAFGPSDADKGKPSFSRATIVSAEESLSWHQANAKTPSLAVWASSVSEVDEAGTRAVDDSKTPLAPDEKRAPGHCYVDYRHLTPSERKRTRALLLARALKRGQVLEA